MDDRRHGPLVADSNRGESGDGAVRRSEASLRPGGGAATDDGESFTLATPSISLPKGGGAIRGMGEKFAANPVTGSAAMTVPIGTSPGRGGFGPQLALSYDSNGGNGPFGFGWSLSIPSITRKTDKGLPRYRDAEESDVYVISGAEDLVPVSDAGGRRHEDTDLDSDHVVHRYRPRVEGLFARIEQWTHRDTGAIHWRVTTRDNVTSLYGVDQGSRIADPEGDGARRTFEWLLARSFDDKGNVVVYEYVAEDEAGIDPGHVNELRRVHTANRYPKRILYGNRTSRLARPDWERDGWLFEVVFDYDEGHIRPLPWDSSLPVGSQHHRVAASAIPTRAWTTRPDPFSSYRAGFEVRTHRRCHRILAFHHFGELTDQTGGQPYLVRGTFLEYGDLEYSGSTEAEGELSHIGSTRVGSFLQSVRQDGFRWDREAGNYLRASLPPVEFVYSKAEIQDALDDADDRIHWLDSTDFENLPVGLDEGTYRWVDLDGEGISGILTEQGGGWFYKSGLGDARFGPMRLLPSRPTASLASGGQQLVDLHGDGQLDVVAFEGPTPGFFERDTEDGWQGFRPFQQVPNVAWGQPNARLIDLNGDGRADLLITECDVFTWYESRGEDGFGAAAQVPQPNDEDKGPRLVLSDGVESLHLADMSGDGLKDLVRVRNGEVCYWPNLGYGRFGPRVVMDDAPVFDRVDQFDLKRLRLADIDGSGTNDIIYLHPEGVRLYFNRAGNGWTAARQLRFVPPTDDLTSVTTVDLLGNGTACLVWSSRHPSHAHCPIRYIDLMGGTKPHLLERTRNNLGLETTVSYAPSTRFYLADKAAGRPWLTRIPFPVHCVASVIVSDRWRDTRFTTSYSYHHGYFDGEEREFHGFGRVEQVDVEDYGIFAAGNSGSPFITDDQTLYQPPVKTVTWFHTGAMMDRERVLSHFAEEYFPRSWQAREPGVARVFGGFVENALPEPDLVSEGLSAEEWRESLRACKGMPLRQETYELDVDALEREEHVPVTLYSAANHNCHIRRLQPRGANRHAVFLVTESEAIAYHYELDLRPEAVEPDPRVAHTLNLAVDEYGQVLQSAAVVYPRRATHDDATLSAYAKARIAQAQGEQHIAYTETRYTDDVDEPAAYRLRLPCETLTYELTGLSLPSGASWWSLDELRRLRLSDRYQSDPTGLTAVAEAAYHRLASDPSTRTKRKVEHVRTLYFDADLSSPLPLGQLNALGLPFESYKLALTEDLLRAVFDADQLAQARAALDDPTVGGYLGGAALSARFPDRRDEYWVRSGVAGFSSDAGQTFYLPERYIDPFGNETLVRFDEAYQLHLVSSTNALGDTTRVTAFDYRVLAPTEIEDANLNRTGVVHDILGMPAAVAAQGKPSVAEGDDLGALHSDVARLHPPNATVAAIFTDAFDESALRDLLRGATARHVYWFGERVDPSDGRVSWEGSPPGACGILRETHVANLGDGDLTALQVAFEYSDGGGNLLATKQKAEPAAGSDEIRWLTSGKTVLNNKGKPVKQYEPYFSSDAQRFEEIAEVGVTSVVYYDAVGRPVRTEQPDGSYSRAEFSPWYVTSWDANDTVLEPGNPWYAERIALPASDPRRQAAERAARHAATPSTVFVDSLGREVVSVAHNRWRDPDGAEHDTRVVTFTKLDAEGKPLWIRDDRGNLVMQYVSPPKPTRIADEPVPGSPEAIPAGSVPAYDIAGNLLSERSMDGGDRSSLADATGQPLMSWDANDRIADDGSRVVEPRSFHTDYDALRRPLRQWLTVGDDSWVVERYEYGETRPDAQARNLRGQLYRHYDPSGVVTQERFDFEGNVLESRRRLTASVEAGVLDWSDGFAAEQLEAETFVRHTEYDALGRMARLFNWHADPRRVAVYEPTYNARGVLASENVFLDAERDAAGRRVGGERTSVVSDLRYNARGQREHVVHGNATVTRHHYDPTTFRLTQIRTTRPGFTEPFPGYRSQLRDERVLQQLYLTYDAVGNITRVHDDAFMPVFFGNERVDAASDYVYDARYRLIDATGREHARAGTPRPGAIERAPGVGFQVTDETLRGYREHYVYDSVGNIERMVHVVPGRSGDSWTRTYTYADDSNRLLSTLVGSEPANTTRYAYDMHGSMLDVGNQAEPYRLQWDYRDMIHRADLGGGGMAYYNYDASKQRSRKVIHHQDGWRRWERIYLGGMERYRRWSSGGELLEEIETHHVFVDGDRVLIVDQVRKTDDRDLGERTLHRYQHGNQLGSVTLELDDDRRIVSYEEYHPYGTSAYRARDAGVAATRKRYRYTGMERDEETGLSYHTARYYLPWLGRWASADPAGLSDGLNVYQYCGGGPCGLADKSGTQSRRRGDSARRRRSEAEMGVPRHLRSDSSLGREQIRPSPDQPRPRDGPRLEIYGDQLWLENVADADVERIHRSVAESLRAGTLGDGPPAGVSAIRTRSGEVYFWQPLAEDGSNAHRALQYRRSEGFGHLREQDVAAVNESLQALQTTLEYYVATVEFAVGVATGISAGPRLAIALGLAVAREAGEQAAMSFVIVPFVSANVEDPAVAAILTLAAGVILGASFSRAHGTRVSRPTVHHPSGRAWHVHHVLRQRVPRDWPRRYHDMHREAAEILEEVGLDRIMGEENLIWAPNQAHGQRQLERVHEVLTSHRGNREAIVGALRGLGYRFALGDFD